MAAVRRFPPTSVALVVAAALTAAASASILTVFDQSDCAGNNETFGDCGCHDVNYGGGYSFSFDGDQAADLYIRPGCPDGDRPEHLNTDHRHCGSSPYRSVHLCSPYAPPGSSELGGVPSAARTFSDGAPKARRCNR